MRIDDHLRFDQQRFCARWLEQRGVYGHPTLQQLMEMAEAWAAYRLRSRSGGAAGAASEAFADAGSTPEVPVAVPPAIR